MSSYPPPPQPDQQHYNLAYTTDQDSQQNPLDGHHTVPLDFDELHQDHSYPKSEVEPELDPHAAAQIEQRIEQLQHHHEHDTHDQIQPPTQSDENIGPQVDSAFLLQGAADQLQQQATKAERDASAKINRLRKACDSCSIRKVKCDEGGQPCKACVTLEIPCTYDRPSRRRGPPNRHAEAIKRRRIDAPYPPVPGAPSSPTHAAQALAALSSHSSTAQISAESICSVEKIDMLINDYFTHIHPLCPFPHEPSFREAWRRREDYNNRTFLALLSSMCAALVASFPRKPRIYLKALRKDNVFPDNLALLDKCQKVCALARGPGYLDSETLSVHDAATSYLLGLAATYTFNWRQARLYLGESFTILKALGLHKAKEDTFNDLGSLPAVLGSDGPSFEGDRDELVDKITLQMGRRIFWTLFITEKSLAQLSGGNPTELTVLSGNAFDEELHPALPEEVDDFCIFPTHIDAQPPGQTALIAGFNAMVRLYWSYSLLPKILPEISDAASWADQVQAYRDVLEECKTILKTVDGDPSTPAHQILLDRDPADLSGGPEPSLEQRRLMQYRIQKASLFTSALCTRVLLADTLLHGFAARRELMDALDEDNGSRRQEIVDEREAITVEVVAALSDMDQINMQPCADSLVQRVRYVANALISAAKEDMGPLTARAEAHVREFLDVLFALERIGVASEIDLLTQEDEDGRRFETVRQCQARFAELVGHEHGLEQGPDQAISHAREAQ